jgi:AcrR family transcriptional regulator
MAPDPDLEAGIAAAGFRSPSVPDIIRAARALFDREPFRNVTIGDVAKSAGVNEVTIYRNFGSKDGLAAACWVGNLERLRRGMKRDERETADPLERIERHLRRLARASVGDRQVTLALIQAAEAQTIERGSKIGSLDPRTIAPIPQLLDPLVAAAQRAGTVTKVFTSFELAAFLTNALFIRFMTRPEATAEEIAEFVVILAFDGIRPKA